MVDTKATMDTTKAKAAIEAAQVQVKALVDSEIARRSFNGLRGLAGADAMLGKAIEKLEAARARVQPKAKKAKKAAK